MSKKNRTPAAPATPAVEVTETAPVETTTSEVSTQVDEPAKDAAPVEVTEDAAPVEVTVSKQAQLDAKRADARAAKKAEKDAAKAATLAKRADGIIGTLYSALCTTAGTTKKEILDVLTAKFPAKDRDGMAVTVGIQLSRLAKQASPKHPEEYPNGRPVSSFKDSTRGRVYGFTDVLIVPEVSIAPAAPVETTETTEENVAA